MAVAGEDTYETVRPPGQDNLENMRRPDLVKWGRARGITDYGNLEDYTADQLREIFRGEKHKPTTRPLNVDPDNVPYEHWAMHGLRTEAKRRGIKSSNTWTEEDFVRELNAHEKEVTSGDDTS